MRSKVLRTAARDHQRLHCCRYLARGPEIHQTSLGGGSFLVLSWAFDHQHVVSASSVIIDVVYSIACIRSSMISGLCLQNLLTSKFGHHETGSFLKDVSRPDDLLWKDETARHSANSA